MAKLPEVLKQAVLEADWTKVCLVYTQITGEPLEPPKPPVVKTEEEALANIEIVLPITTEVDTVKTESVLHVVNSSYVSPIKQSEASEQTLDQSERRCSRQPIKVGPRKSVWIDNRTEAVGDLKDLNPQLKAMYGNKEHVTRSDKGQSFKTVKVQCSICKKTEDISPKLAYGYDKDPEENTYKCTDCSTPSGRARAMRVEFNNG